jgi:hypothetical protein
VPGGRERRGNLLAAHRVLDVCVRSAHARDRRASLERVHVHRIDERLDEAPGGPFDAAAGGEHSFVGARGPACLDHDPHLPVDEGWRGAYRLLAMGNPARRHRVDRAHALATSMDSGQERASLRAAP